MHRARGHAVSRLLLVVFIPSFTTAFDPRPVVTNPSAKAPCRCSFTSSPSFPPQSEELSARVAYAGCRPHHTSRPVRNACGLYPFLSSCRRTRRSFCGPFDHFDCSHVNQLPRMELCVGEAPRTALSKKSLEKLLLLVKKKSFFFSFFPQINK